MKPSPRQSSPQRAIRLLSHKPTRALVIAVAVKRWAGILLVSSFIAFMILMLPTAFEISFFGWHPVLYGGTFVLPFGISLAVTLVLVAVWATCGWILQEARWE